MKLRRCEREFVKPKRRFSELHILRHLFYDEVYFFRKGMFFM